jgi:hypothetical protein
VVASRISPSQEKHILVATTKLPISLEKLEGPKFSELQKYSHFQSAKEVEMLGNTYDRERSLRIETEEFSTCISTNPSCTKEINHAEEEDVHRYYTEN